MIQKVVSAVGRWRLKFSLAVGMTISGTVMAFLNTWTATEVTYFYLAVLGVFATADVSEKVVQK